MVGLQMDHPKDLLFRFLHTIVFLELLKKFTMYLYNSGILEILLVILLKWILFLVNPL